MAHFKITHSAFRDVHAKIDLKAASLVVTGEMRAGDLVARLKSCGATDVTSIKLSPAEYREIVMSRLPQLSAGAR
jgi:hypothetical protein